MRITETWQKFSSKEKLITLLGLLTVIVILSVTVIIAIPAVVNLFNTPDQPVMNIPGEEESTFPSRGKINGLTAFIKELGSGKRYRTVSGSFDNYWIRYNWQDVVGSLSGYEISYPDPPSVRYKPQWLSDHGLRIQVKTFGAPHNPLDLYYNETYRNTVIADALAYFDGVVWKDLVEQIVLGDEAPVTLYNWNLMDSITRYNDTFHDEMGIWMRSSYDNSRDEYIFDNWISSRTTAGMNLVYNAFKAAYPDIQIGWGTMPAEYFEPKDLKGDFITGGYYTEDFRHFYSMIRRARLDNPDVPVESVITGNNEMNNPLQVPFKIQEQSFWTSYFAGGDVLYWFDMGNNAHWDNIGLEETFESYKFHSKLNQLANALPVLVTEPLVLEIDTFRGAEIGASVGFREWDSTSQLRASTSDFSLEQYDVVVVENQFEAIDAFYDKIADYVANGGNLIIKGINIVGTLLNITDEPRAALLPLETVSPVTTQIAYDKNLFTLQDDFLGVEIPPLYEVAQRWSINFTKTDDWTVIHTGMPEEDQGFYPLAVYHNQSNPDSGNILYYGFAGDPTVTSDSVERLYALLVHQFVDNYLGIKDLTAPVDHPDWIITTGLDDQNHTIIGIIPDETSGKIDVQTNVTLRDLPRENTFFYKGFAEAVWLGDTDQDMSSFSTTVDAYEPQRWVLAEPETAHDVQVHVQYPEREPIPGEPFPIKISVLETLDRQDINNAEIKFSLPAGVTFSDGATTAKQTLTTLKAMQKKDFYWLVEATAAGLYMLTVQVSSPDLDETLSYNFSIRVYSGRIEFDLPTTLTFTQEEEFYLSGSLTYQGSEKTTISIETIVQDYVWGNPGGLEETITLNPGKTHSFRYVVEPQEYLVGETAHFKIFAEATAGEIYAEDYTSIEVVLIHDSSTVTKGAVRGLNVVVVITSGCFLFILKRRGFH